MTCHHQMLWAAALAVGAVPVLFAQDAGHKTAARPAPVLSRLAALLGSEVGNSKQEKLGHIKEFVVDPQTGTIRDAVLTLAGKGDKHVAVSWSAFTWDPLTRKGTLASTLEQLERAPAWSPEGGRDAAGKTADGASADKDGKGDKPKDKEGVPTEASAGRAPAHGADHPMLASRLAALRVAAGTDDLGTPGDVYAELRTGRLAFVTLTLGDVLGVGGKTYVVPWSALLLQNQDHKPLLKLATMDRKQLEGAPRQEGKEDIQNPTFRGRVYQYFGVRLPEYEPEHDLSAKGDDRNDSSQKR